MPASLARHHQPHAIIAKRFGPVRVPDHARQTLDICAYLDRTACNSVAPLCYAVVAAQPLRRHRGVTAHSSVRDGADALLQI
jgi:hypothetical protein